MKIRKLLFENLGLKIASILLSIVLWFFVTSRGQSEMSIDVPLEFKNIPFGLEMVNPSVKTVSLNIRGQERLIKNIRPSDVRAYIDLGKTKRGENICYITRDDIKLPYAITVISISPSSIKVLTEETLTKVVKVVPFIIGELGKGFYIKSVESSPQTVEIEGIRSEINKVPNIKTEPFDVTDLNEKTTQDLKLDLTGRNIRTKVNDVKVTIIIGERRR